MHPAATRLAERYDEPWRHYHTRRHVEEMLTALRSLTGDLHPALELAAWAHDVVYDPHAPAGANERASAELARRELAEAGVEEAVVEEVVDLTLATITHTVPPHVTDPQRVARTLAFLDADVWILSAAPARFDEYEAQIRQEYAFVPQSIFDQARAAVLAEFAARPAIYASRGAGDWEASARINLSRTGHQG